MRQTLNRLEIQISIHALREEGGARSAVTSALNCIPFQSTPSARRAAIFLVGSRSLLCNFNPRPPRGGRLPRFRRMRRKFGFQSTPSARRAAFVGKRAVHYTSKISIHALREEGGFQRRHIVHDVIISIHALREEGGGCFFFASLFRYRFQSTPSARRAAAKINKNAALHLVDNCKKVIH